MFITWVGCDEQKAVNFSGINIFSMLNYEIISLLIIHAAGARYCHLALKNVNKNMAAGMMSVFVEL